MRAIMMLNTNVTMARIYRVLIWLPSMKFENETPWLELLNIFDATAIDVIFVTTSFCIFLLLPTYFDIALIHHIKKTTAKLDIKS